VYREAVRLPLDVIERRRAVAAGIHCLGLLAQRARRAEQAPQVRKTPCRPTGTCTFWSDLIPLSLAVPRGGREHRRGAVAPGGKVI
jgi:hypothetical protein